MSNKFVVDLTDLVAASNNLAVQVQLAIQNEADIPNEVILALSVYKEKEKKFENLLDLLLTSTVILN